MTAAERFSRIVSLIAIASAAAGDQEDDSTFDQLARQAGLTVAELQADLRTLTLLGDGAQSDWLLSLSVWQEGDRVGLESRGPFRRPIRFMPEELIAVQAGLLADEEGKALARRIATLGGASKDRQPPVTAIAGPDGPMQLLLEHAVREHVRVRIRYAGAGEGAVSERVIQPHLLVGHEGMGYCVSWCETANGWRRFRFDRVLEVNLLDGFTPRDDFDAATQDTAFEAPDERVELVTVRFSSRISRWIAERHPDASTTDDGSVEVTFPVADPGWLVRHVLQYGPEAEVVSPPGYRELVRAAVS